MSLQKIYSGLLSLVAVASFSTAAQAQVSIFSNSSGYNSSNAQGHISGANNTSLGRYSESVVSQATSLNQSLAAAQQAVVNAEYRASGKNNMINRYTRQPSQSVENCPPDPSAVAELERARASLAEANAAASTFLQSVSNPSAEMVQRTGSEGCITCNKGW